MHNAEKDSTKVDATSAQPVSDGQQAETIKKAPSQSSNNEQKPKSTLAKFAFVVALVAAIGSGIAVYQVFTTSQAIDYDSHIVKMNTDTKEGSEETETEIATTITESTLKITPTKNSMTVKGGVLLEHKTSSEPNSDATLVEETEVNADTVVDDTKNEDSENVAKENAVDANNKKVFIPLNNDGLTIDYIAGENLLVINDFMEVKLVSTNEVELEGAATLDSDAGTQVLVLSKKLTDEISIVAHAEHKDASQISFAQAVFSDIYESAQVVDDSVEQKYVFDGMTLHSDWTVNLKMITSVLELSNEKGEHVYLSNFTNSVTGAGMTTSADLTDSVKVKYNASIKDSSTGLIPFLYSHDEGTVKILATSTDIIANIIAPDIASENTTDVVAAE